MDAEATDFDFAAWLSEPGHYRPFQDCVRAAVNSLALGQERLRERLFGAVFCLSFCREREVPGPLAPNFQTIREDVLRRAGLRDLNATMGQAEFGRLRRSILRCNPRTAARLARLILEMERYLGSHPTT